MSSSAAFATPPAPGGDNFGLRPLDAIAATSQGGVPQSRVHRILTDLEAPLAALHEQGSLHGALSPATIGLDLNGKAHLMPRPGATPDGAAPLEGAGSEEFELPQAGYAAFEQYADDALLPRGPWTDIYGLSAVACQLITGAPPPDAEARRDHDDYVPLARRMPEGYDAAFLSAIDAGLALAAARRPNSMAAYLASFGSLEPAPAMPALAEPEVVVVQEAYRADEAEGTDQDDSYDDGDEYGDKYGDDPTEPARRRRLSFWGVFLLLLLAVLAVPAWLWFQNGREANAGRGRTPTGASFVPLTQRDTRPAQPGGVAADGGNGAQRATGTGAGGDAGGPSTGTGASTSTPSAATGLGAGTDARPAGPQSSRDPAAATDPGTTGATAGSAAPPPAGQPGADTGSSGRSAPAPQPYHSTVTLGGGSSAAAAPATPGAATEGQPAGGSAAVAAGQDTEAGQGAQTPGADAAKPAKPPAGPPVLVRVDVRPWGEIVVDGVSRGVSPPLKELRLTPGKHSVIIKNTGLPNYRMTLEVKAGTPAVISYVFN